jgi:beta-lactam-binding protein with PASTA domain
VRRDGKWQLDNGYCRASRLVAYFSGEGPDDEADCKPNEVSVPLVLGMTEAGAEATLAAQPLGAKVVYRPAKAGALPGLVVDQDPRRGGLSANDEVTVVVSKARFGMLPNFVGSSVADAQHEAIRLKIRLRAKTAPGPAAAILRQSPAPGVAVAPGMRVRLVVGDGSRT